MLLLTVSDFTKDKEWCIRLRGTKYLSSEPISFDLGKLGSNLTYVVPSGFEFDVSIPRGLRFILSPHNPKYLKAAAIHDHMLKANWDRPTAGGVFQAALKVSGVSSSTRLTMFFAVTLWKWH